jgi:hypothetical protein
MLGNLDTWADELRAAQAETDARAAIVHVRRNIEQTALGLRRLLGTGPPDADPNGS